MPRKTNRSAKRKSRRSRKSSKKRSGLKLSRHPLLLIFLLLGVAGFLPYSHSTITDRVRSMLEQITDGSCTVRKASLIPFRGLALKKVVVTRNLDRRSHASMEIPYMQIRYSPIRILINRKKAMEHVAYLVRSGKSAYIDSLVEDGFAGMRIRGARASIMRSGGANSELEGIHAKIAVQQVEGMKAEGWVALGQLKNGPFRIKNVKTDISIEGSRIKVSNLKGDCYRGRLGGTLFLDGEKGRVLDGTITLRKVELARLYADYPRKVGALEGEADIRLKLMSSSWEPDHIRGKGELNAQDIYAEKIPLLNTIVTTLTLPQLRTLRFKNLKTDVVLSGKKITVSNMQGNGQPIDIWGTGLIDADNKLDMRVEGFFPESFRDSLSPITWNALFPDEKNKGRTFTCRVQGTYDNPWITIDRKHTRRAVKKVFSSFGQRIGAAFRGGEKREN
ncbi:MAG: AsmA-like C-terminal region-containing protein [Fibrobacterota bacterium]